MRSRGSRIGAAALTGLILAVQVGSALAAEEESKSRQTKSGAETQAGAQVTVAAPPPPGGPGFPPGRQPAPEEIQKNMQAMAPMMGQMMTLMLESMARKLAEPQMAEYYAAFMRNYYQALLKQGFTEEQALKIIAATGLPSTGHRQ